MRSLSRISGMDAAVGAVATIWAVFILNALAPPLDLNALGIRPRTVEGLRGVLFWPLLHRGLPHILANTAAIFPLMLITFSLSRKLGWVSLASAWLLGGLIVWLFGRGGAVHIGASGVVFGLIGFLAANGVFRKEWRAFLVALIVLICYGGALATLLHRVRGVSWVGHAGGLVAGVLAAWKTKHVSRFK